VKSPASALLVGSFAFVALVVACNQKPPDLIRMDKPAGTTATSSASPDGATAKPVGAPAAAVQGVSGEDSLAYDAAAAAQGYGPPNKLAYRAPAGWTSVRCTSASCGPTFKIPKAGGDSEDADLALTVARSGDEAHVKQWEEEFGGAKAKTRTRTVNGLKVTIVELRGTFSGSSDRGAPVVAPKDNQVLLGAIVEAEDRQHCFKMWGGEKTMSAARKDFDKLVASFRPM
jgi:hypothetical protein